MTGFGDYELADVWDTAPPAVEQVAYRIHRYRRYLGQLGGSDPGKFSDMSAVDQNRAMQVAREIVDWVSNHDPVDRLDLPRVLHGLRQTAGDSLTDWWDLTDDVRDVAEAVADAIAAWLIRQGAWQ